jgi:hypothetical protein
MGRRVRLLLMGQNSTEDPWGNRIELLAGFG